MLVLFKKSHFFNYDQSSLKRFRKSHSTEDEFFFISLVIYFSLKNRNVITINQVLFSIEVVKGDHVYNVPRKSFELYLQHDF